jgi:hypothetical protein
VQPYQNTAEIIVSTYRSKPISTGTGYYGKAVENNEKTVSVT